jgi:hypothetical protein
MSTRALGWTVMLSIAVQFWCGKAKAQAVSAGGIFGDPLGVTMRYSSPRATAFDASFGPDYFGSPRLQLDYVWQFHAFHSELFGEYAGPGLAVAFAKGINSFYTHERHKESFADNEDNRFDLGGRAIFGVTITPRASRLEFFVESGPLLPASRVFDLDLDGAVGFRYRLWPQKE